MEQAMGGERAEPDAAIAAFVAEHNDRLLRMAFLVCREMNDAADAVQTGLEQAWRRRSALQDPARLRPWLDRVVMREAVRVSKRRRSWLGRLFTPPPDVGWIELPAQAGAEPATYLALREGFRRLSPEQRAAVALHLYFGYTIAETADIVGAPEETVRSRLRLAKQRLRTELEESAP
jgi:RNA polymerase sigma-70 factor (ECF subfamily)